MRSPLFILVTTFVLTLLLAQALAPTRTSGNPNQPLERLAHLLKRHHDLGAALAAADRGQPAELLSWLNRAPALTKQELAGVLIHAALAVADVPVTEVGFRADQALYRWRLRLLPFAQIPTGSEVVDAMLGNYLAYIVVAGTATPVPAEIKLATALLPRLEKQVADKPAAEIYDTIGCVYFVNGDFARARTAFSEAVRLGEQNRDTSDEGRMAAAIVPLYRARLEAAIAADLQSVEQRDLPTPRPPLPLPADVVTPVAK